MGALTDNASKAARGDDSMLKNGILAQHLDWFEEEYRDYPFEVFEEWMEGCSDNRGAVYIQEFDAIGEMSRILQKYEYDPREEFGQFFKRLIVFGAMKRFCRAEGVDLMTTKISMFDTDGQHLLSELATHIVLKDKTIDPVEREMLFQCVVERTPVNEIAKANECRPETVDGVVKRLSKRVDEIKEKLLRID